MQSGNTSAYEDTIPLLQKPMNSKPMAIVPASTAITSLGRNSTLARAPPLESSLTSSRFAAGSKSRLERVRPSLLLTNVDKEAQWTGRLSVFCTCNTYSMPEIFQRFNEMPDWKCRRISRDVIHVRRSIREPDLSEPATDAIWWVGVEDHTAGCADIFFFSYGVAITFGLSEGAEWQLLDTIKPFENGRMEDEVEHETYDYAYYDADSGTDSRQVFSTAKLMRIEHDLFLLARGLDGEDLIHLKLAIAHGIAQSGKLSSFENAVETIFKRVEHFPVELARTGMLNISDRRLLQLSGELCVYGLYINLQTDILEVPEWFWDNTVLEPVYESTSKYMDIRSRVSVLNKRLDVISDMFSLFREERHISYGHKLEEIVIWLIVVEVVLDLLELAALLFEKV
uniref:DUF155 domain-containing protein n=1 Tax=Timspurckia oligopyrenoides TaxID=708627 RepID=A0A7S0ZBX4_9RHOD|mmetsp:Transcript_11754/g.21267  ORF Transcript_11754/g.21267 Transcript_11754/m.21267 type:complete len:397 (+) Transcript_11754:33-1223(+)